MSEHFQTPLPRATPPKKTRYDDALADARLHLERIPRHNLKGIEDQKKRIQYWERLVAAERGESWLE